MNHRYNPLVFERNTRRDPCFVETRRERGVFLLPRRVFVREKAYFARGPLTEDRRSREKVSRLSRRRIDFDLEPNREYFPFFIPRASRSSLSFGPITIQLKKKKCDVEAREHSVKEGGEGGCGVSRETSCPRLGVAEDRGPRDLNSRSRRARQGRVTVHG